MQRRAVLSLVNLAVAVGVLLVIFLYPRFAGYAIYAFLGWFAVSFALVWTLRGAAPAPAPSATGTIAGATGPVGMPRPARTPAPAAPPPPTEVGFCIFCATDLPPGAGRCPSCGHPRARFA